MAAERRELEQRMGAGALPGLGKLDDDDVVRLCGLFDAACARQGEALQQATEQALKHVPALLRPAVRKLLF